MIEATLNVLGKTYTAKGETIPEAIASLKPGNIAGRLVLTINGRERVIPPVMGKRAFQMEGMSRAVAIKNLSLLFE